MSNSSSSEPRYWHSTISEVEPEHVFVRGYDLEDLIGLPFGAATFLLIKGRIPTPLETKVVDAILTGVLDYGLQKAGTVAARAVVSSNPNMQAGLATAVLAAGDFSLSPENAARYIINEYEQFLESGLTQTDYASKAVERATASKFRIPGFGHPVFRGKDPRSQKLIGIAKEAGLWSGPAALYEAIHAEFTKNPKVSHFPINDVGVLAALSVAMGFTPQEATALVVIGTLPGVAAHISEEITTGKPIRVIPNDQVDYEVGRRDFSGDARNAGWDL